MNNRTNQILAAIGLAVATGVAPSSAQAAPNLLFDGDFDLNSPLTTFPAILSPFAAGQWAVENATNTTATAGVTPNSSPRMLQMSDDGQVLTQAGQAVPVNAGDYLTLSALFTTGTGVSGAIAGVFLDFYGANFGPTTGPEISATLNLDANDTTWESLSISGFAPAGTQWVVAQVTYNDASLQNSAGLPENVGFVDDASLTAAPEPASMAILGVALAGLAGLRRRRG